MRHYRLLVREFKRTYGPFSVRRVKMPRGFAGDCNKRRGKFVIRIDRKLEEQAAMDAVVHEVAHMLSWTEHQHGIEHGRRWACKFAECYGVYKEVCERGDP